MHSEQKDPSGWGIVVSSFLSVTGPVLIGRHRRWNKVLRENRNEQKLIRAGKFCSWRNFITAWQEGSYVSEGNQASVRGLPADRDPAFG